MMKSIHSDRLERWLGAEKIAKVSRDMKGWHGPPINLRDVPGSVWVDKHGDFSGTFERGFFASAADSMAEHLKFLWREAGKPIYHRECLNVGFASIGDALLRASSGNRQLINGQILKTGSTGVISVSSSLWRAGSMPASGAAGSAAPGGRALTKATTGAMVFENPSSGTLHLTGADITTSVANNSLMLYDRIFDVAKTMNSTATEAVTGVPTRYQSSTPSSDAYSGGNFLFIEVGGTALAATAHNWTVCTYTDQDGNTGATLPSVTGNSGAIVDRFDMPAATWFCPLASGDSGIKELTQMQCSALVATGAINFVIGHPIGIMVFPIINTMFPFDWLTNRDQAPRIFDDAALSLIEICKPTTTTTVYSGQIYATSAAP
jgi:hypothetical protein